MRRNWIPTVGMALAACFVAWLGWINLRGSGSGAASTVTPSASVRPSGSGSASASASPSADPAVAQVEAAAKKWVQAYYDAYRTADASALNAMVVPDTQAAGVAGAPRVAVLNSHRTMLISQLTFDTLHVEVAAESASADLTYTTVASPADWPSLTVTGPPSTKHWTSHMALTLSGGKWLVDSFA